MLRSLLAMAAVLLPAPALADVTAKYGAGAGTITIEADDSGDWRFHMTGPLPLVAIRHGGVHYVVFTDSDDWVSVVLAEDLFAAMLEKAPPPPASYGNFVLEQGTADSFGGYSGMTWRFAPEGENPLRLLMSPDPALAPIGDVFRSIAALAGKQIMPLIADGGNFEAQLNTLFAKGTPLRILPIEENAPPVIELESVSMAEIDPKQFVLPGPVISADEVITKLGV